MPDATKPPDWMVRDVMARLDGVFPSAAEMREAAVLAHHEATIADLSDRVRVLEEALRPFAEATPRGCDLSEIGLASLVSCDLVGITGDEIRAARAALEGSK